MIALVILSASCDNQGTESIITSKTSRKSSEVSDLGTINTEKKTQQQLQTEEIMRRQSDAKADKLIKSAYSLKDLLDKLYFNAETDNVNTMLNNYNEKVPVECLRTFKDGSLPYCIYKIKEGGYLYIFFHGTSLKFANLGFVVKKPLSKTDFSRIKNGDALEKVEDLDEGIKSLFTGSDFFNDCLNRGTEYKSYHMVKEGFVIVSYVSDVKEKTTDYHDKHYKVTDVKFIENGGTINLVADHWEGARDYKYTLLDGDYLV
jgi:hypothetical protein